MEQFLLRVQSLHLFFFTDMETFYYGLKTDEQLLCSVYHLVSTLVDKC